MVNKKEILCPYCCKRFGTNQVHFRLEAPLIDEVVEEIDEDFEELGIGRRRTSEKKNTGTANGKVLDEKLFHYYMTQHGDERIARNEAMNYGFVEFDAMNPEIEFNRRDFQQHGYVHTIRYRDQELDTRLCPYCHMNLLQSAGKYDMYMVSVVGDTAVGKSIYLAVLQTMIERGPFNASMMFMGTKEEKEHYLAVKKKVVMEQRGVEATSGRVPPLTFQLTYDVVDSNKKDDRDSVLITFCDIEGEKCRDSENLQIYGNHLRESDGLMFLIDPTRFSRIKNSISSGAQIGNSYQIEVISAINQFLISGTYDEKSNIPVAVMVTKSDVLKDVPYFLESSSKMRLLNDQDWNEIHAGYLNQDVIREIDQGVTSFLNDMGEQDFVRKMGDLFNDYSFFINSALGHALEKEEDDSDDATELLRSGNISPYRVTEAFYWLLAENNIIPRKRTQRYRNTKTHEEKEVSVFYYKKDDEIYVRQKLELLKEAQGIKNSLFGGKWEMVSESYK